MLSTRFQVCFPVWTSHLLTEWSNDAEYIVSLSVQTTAETHSVCPLSVEIDVPFKTIKCGIKYESGIKDLGFLLIETNERVQQLLLKAK